MIEPSTALSENLNDTRALPVDNRNEPFSVSPLTDTPSMIAGPVLPLTKVTSRHPSIFSSIKIAVLGSFPRALTANRRNVPVRSGAIHVFAGDDE